MKTRITHIPERFIKRNTAITQKIDALYGKQRALEKRANDYATAHSNVEPGDIMCIEAKDGLRTFYRIVELFACVHSGEVRYRTYRCTKAGRRTGRSTKVFTADFADLKSVRKAA